MIKQMQKGEALLRPYERPEVELVEVNSVCMISASFNAGKTATEYEDGTDNGDVVDWFN